MGSASSKNTMSSAVSAYASATNESFQAAVQDSKQRTSMKFKDIIGDVNITGNVIRQTTKMSQQSYAKLIMCNSVEQQVQNNLRQAASSELSGMNLGQLADAQNDISTVVNVASAMRNTISQSCAAAASQDIDIEVEKVQGNVNVKDNTIEQITDLVGKCTMDALNSNSSVASATQSMDQVSSATATGLPPWLLATVAICITVGTVATIAGSTYVTVVGSVGVAILSIFAGAIILAIGCVIAAIYTGLKDKSGFDATPNIDLILPFGGVGTKLGTSTMEGSIYACGVKCDREDGCAAFHATKDAPTDTEWSCQLYSDVPDDIDLTQFVSSSLVEATNPCPGTRAGTVPSASSSPSSFYPSEPATGFCSSCGGFASIYGKDDDDEDEGDEVFSGAGEDGGDDSWDPTCPDGSKPEVPPAEGDGEGDTASSAPLPYSSSASGPSAVCDTSACGTSAAPVFCPQLIRSWAGVKVWAQIPFIKLRMRTMSIITSIVAAVTFIAVAAAGIFYFLITRGKKDTVDVTLKENEDKKKGEANKDASPEPVPSEGDVGGRET